MNKRGNIMDIVLVVVLLFGIAIALLPTLQVFDSVANDLNKSSSISDTTKNTLNSQRTIAPKVMDSLFLFVFFAAFISIGVSAYFIRSNALFFMIAVITLTVFAFVAAILSNTWNDYVTSSASFESYSTANLTFTNHLMNNYVIYVVVLGFIAIIALYAKRSTGAAV